MLHDADCLPLLLNMLTFPDVWEVLIQLIAHEAGRLDQFALVLRGVVLRGHVVRECRDQRLFCCSLIWIQLRIRGQTLCGHFTLDIVMLLVL